MWHKRLEESSSEGEEKPDVGNPKHSATYFRIKSTSEDEDEDDDALLSIYESNDNEYGLCFDYNVAKP